MSSKTVGSGTAANNTGSAAADYTSFDTWHGAETGSSADVTCITKVDAIQTTQFTASASAGTYLVTADSATYVNAPTYAAANSRARITATVSISGSGWTWEKVSIISSSEGMLNSAGCAVRRAFIKSAGTNALRTVGTAQIYTISNLAMLSTSVVGISQDSGSSTANVYHVSVLDNGGAFGFFYVEPGQTVNCYACIYQGSGTGWRGGGTKGGTDNISQDGSAVGGNKRTNISGVFKNTSAGSEDLNLNGLNGGLLQGVADYSGSCGDVTTDLNGNARPAAAGFPIDPGCAQIASGPSILGYSSSGALSTSTSTTETVSLNVPSGTKLLVVCASGSDAISSATWNGVAMTAAAAEQNASGTRTRIFLLANPDTGTHDAVVTYTSCNRRWIAVYALAEANNSNPPALDVADGTTGSGGSVSKSTTPSVANTGVLDILANSSSGANPTPNSPQVFKQKCTGSSFFEAATSCRLAPTATSTSEGWTEDTGYNISYSIVYLKSGVASAYLSPVVFFNRRLKHSNLRR